MINIETEKVAVENLMKAIEAAENRKDLTAMLGAMTDDAVVQVGGAPMLQGHAAIRQLYVGIFPVFVSHKHHRAAHRSCHVRRCSLAVWNPRV